ncbi:hypothetical protein BRC81_17195 [Halobacteriales archaeon QS_1_68_20]|nr:MAG: hypothetical protein BRC81_17195 [Halobacteriales archaeon QS_1_68_20]
MTVRRALLDAAGRYDEHAHRADYYHQRRADAIAAGETRLSSGERPGLVFHLVPESAFAGDTAVSIPDDVGEGGYLPVLARGEGEVTFTADGVVAHCTSYGVTGAYVRVSRNGIVEASSHAFFTGYEDDDRTRLPATTFESAFVAGVREYLAFLEVLGVRTPVRLVLSLVNVSGVDLVHSPEEGPYVRENFPGDRVEPLGVTLRSYDGDPHEERLGPLVDAVWNAAGIDGSHERRSSSRDATDDRPGREMDSTRPDA